MRSAFISVAVAALAMLADADTVRERFNFGWKFRPGALGKGAAERVNESRWEYVDLPHDFQFEQPWSEKASRARGFKESGEGVYRKRFFVPAEWKGEAVRLDFEALLAYGDVYLNGKLIGGSDFGYLGCVVELTDALRYGSDNVVAVHASTGRNSISRWYTGGGIIRDVWLEHGPKAGFARHGVYVTTPVVSADAAEIEVIGQLDGFKGNTNDISLTATIFNDDGAAVGRTSGKLWEYNLTRPEVRMPRVKVSQPKLWSCDTPNLYSVEVKLSVKGVHVDTRKVSFGIRKIEYGPDFGFRLNGKKFYMRGVANHHDLGALGAAAFPRAIERYVRRLKEFGYNTIRTSHNPYSVSLLEICDRLGMLVVDEWSDKWSESGNGMCSRKPFHDVWPSAIPEWICRDRNHPSVVLWSLGNELQLWDSTSGYHTDDWGVTTYRILDVMVKRYDATRPTTVAQYPAARNAQKWTDPDNHIDPKPSALLCATEVASQNYMPGLYAEFKRKAPHLILFQSEAGTKGLLGSVLPMDMATSVGFAYWGAVEYWGESDGWPKKGWNYSYFSHSLEPYPQAWLMRSWADLEDPVIKIGVEIDKGAERIWNDMKVGQRRIVSAWNFAAGSKWRVHVYSNAGEVELQVNGRSLGTKVPSQKPDSTYNTATWEGVEYGTGGEIVAIGRLGGAEVSRDVIVTAAEPVGLEVMEEAPGEWVADGMDLKFIRLYAVDANGVRHPWANEPVRVSVQGNACLAVLDDGDHYTDQLFNVSTKRMHNGFLMPILRAGREPGKVQLTIDAGRLGKKVEIFHTKPSKE